MQRHSADPPLLGSFFSAVKPNCVHMMQDVAQSCEMTTFTARCRGDADIGWFLSCQNISSGGLHHILDFIKTISHMGRLVTTVCVTNVIYSELICFSCILTAALKGWNKPFVRDVFMLIRYINLLWANTCQNEWTADWWVDWQKHLQLLWLIRFITAKTPLGNCDDIK